MANSRTPPRRQAPAPAAEDPPDLEAPAENDIEQVLETLKSGDNMSVCVYRTPFHGTTLPPDQKGYVGRVEVEDFNEERIAELFGPGRYRIRLKDARGRFVPDVGGVLTIARAPATARPAPGGQQAAVPASELTQILELMRKENESRERAGGGLMRELAPALIAALPGLIQAMRGGNTQLDAALVAALKPAPVPSLAEQIAALQSLRALNPEGGGDIDRLIKLAELGKKLSGAVADEGGTGAGWVDVLRDVVKEAPALLAALPAARPQPPQQVHVRPAAPVQPALTPPQPTPVPQPQGPEDMNIIIDRALRAAAAQLCEWAAANRKPDLYAEVFIDQLPSWVWNAMKPTQALEWLKREDWWSQAVQFWPAAAPYQGWASEFRYELITLLTEMVENEGESDATEH